MQVDRDRAPPPTTALRGARTERRFVSPRRRHLRLPMSKSSRSLVRSTLQRLRQLWKRRDDGRREMRRCLGSTFELLEPRLALTISSPLPPISGTGAHIHPILQIYLDGQHVVIPAGVGLTSTQAFGPHTHDFTGKLHIGEGGLAGI